MNSKYQQQSITRIRGYLEGYYGKLLSWTERDDLLKYLANLGLSTYCYAPKEDIQHRLRWRELHSQEWQKSFAQFCQSASDLEVSIVAGIAPGLDFDFDPKDISSSDFQCLLTKAKNFLHHGAHEILVLWDDIDEDGYVGANGVSEGTAHARVINQLSESLGRPIWTVPRVYAEEIDNKNHYLEDFFEELQSEHTVLLCGKAIVASRVEVRDLLKLSCHSGVGDSTLQPENTTINNSSLKHRTILWDNFYANDYCPRRLFLGPWSGREHITEYLLNPTGLPFTDRLLLDIAQSTRSGVNRQEEWRKALNRHGVPDAFLTIAPYFSEPFFGDRTVLSSSSDTEGIEPTNEVEKSIEQCLWKWKSPLAREWYPFIFGLKHDLALASNSLPRHRVLKTQPAALAKRLLT